MHDVANAVPDATFRAALKSCLSITSRVSGPEALNKMDLFVIPPCHHTPGFKQFQDI